MHFQLTKIKNDAVSFDDTIHYTLVDTFLEASVITVECFDNLILAQFLFFWDCPG